MKTASNRRTFNQGALLSLVAALTARSAPLSSAQAQPAGGASARREIIKQPLPGNSDLDLTLVEVTYPPGAGSPPHLHANGVMAFVVAGEIASQVGEGREQTYRAGEAWWEPPGAVHRVSRNASTTETATLLAIYIAPKGASGVELMKPL
ncbi:cupin domain-containing protein [Bradyrhizobium sp. ARR65]|uniref:cupin domain-containing protein n=1 Tax=Bradyrhizobium sp. ARR65 TaxID=1040989 RepID=UPI000685ED10|nr:cupin domain-containing protein [Bradyrhizobium sp. ARR65]